MDFLDFLSSPVESPGVTYPQDYYIKTMNFLTSSGQKIDLKKVMLEFSYYEDIYNFSVSGYIRCEDGQGFIELLQLTGNEYIEINFGKVKDSPNGSDLKYRVYKIGDRQAYSQNLERYTLFFCSDELLLSEQSKISKSYKGQKISDIVLDVLQNELQVEGSKINDIEETTGVYDFIVPRLKPFETVSWVSTYGRPKATGTIGADMLLFQTKDGFNFRSLQSMFTGDVYNTYRYEQNNLNETQQPLQDKANIVLQYEIKKSFDVVKDIASGTFANKLISIDPLTRSFNTTEFDLEKFKQQSESLNSGDVINNLKNRFGETLNQAADSVIKMAVGNSNQSSNQYIKEKQGGFGKDIFLETIIPQRTSQLSLANYNVVKLMLPGDPGITAGRVVEFNLMTIKPTLTKKELNPFYSGKYLVTAVRHIIRPLDSSFQTILEIAKDSSEKQPQNVNNSNPVWKDAITGA
jgi:hypothetical protein